jgi:hypothetical protein
VTRVIAIDWSGAKTRPRKKIWLAEAAGPDVVRLETDRDREQIAAHLIDEAARNPRMVIGLDFAFSLPLWYLREHSIASAPALWARFAAGEAERLLAACAAPFWGRPGKPRPAHEQFRRSERDVGATAGIRPKSVFQIGGAGAVGTGSLRGMCTLHALHQAGFSIWPFDPPGWPRVVEIYPRRFTGPVRKSDAAARSNYIQAHYPALPVDTRHLAISSEDAFDACVSALIMALHVSQLEHLPRIDDPQLRLEGAIWQPAATTLPA